MSLLDDISKIKPVNRKTWHYDEEPAHLGKSKYYLAYMPMTGVPYWEESDSEFRKRIEGE